MRIATTIPQLQKALALSRKKNRSIGFVPTMGALHQGHAALLRRCRKENDVSVLSIFVNPTQFGPNEDLSKYPRDKKKDVLLAKKENVDIIFYPSEKMMYPAGYLTFVEVAELGQSLEGRSRPGHFKGVATVVAKLLNIVGPDVMYLGAKDAQQCVVLKRLVEDLNIAVKVTVCPTVREPDGLAMSSRNQYLSPFERKDATVLYSSLLLAQNEIKRGLRDAMKIRFVIEQNIRTLSKGEVDYVACVNGDTLEPLTEIKGNVLITLAARWGKTRLIDNISLSVK
ncbi:MAG: pantoate--beta-alanine ligase [Candidatus Omnitrophica bacterium]|nr:pantoate--beta-alanine ligase [Candidatus Omnitrophota bacterium]